MSDIGKFGGIAANLSRGPLGIIALFIVLVYGFAALVTGFTGSFSTSERLPLIWFMALFPVLVLCLFVWLVSKHHEKLYPPSDFRDDKTFMAIVALSLAQTTRSADSQEGAAPAVEAGEAIEDAIKSVNRAKHTRVPAGTARLLWVDDNPSNNAYTYQAFKAMGVQIHEARSTQAALNLLQRQNFDAIISDMGRAEGPQEGYVLLEELRKFDAETPFFVHSSSATKAQRDEAKERGAQGSTADPGELFDLVMAALPR